MTKTFQIVLVGAMSLAAWGCPNNPPTRATNGGSDAAMSDAGDAGVADVGSDAATDIGPDVGPPDVVANFDATAGGAPGASMSPDTLGPLWSSTTCIASHVPTGDSADQAAERQYSFERLHELDITYIRQDFLWNEIEPTQGTFDFSGYDRLVNDGAAHGVKVIAILDYGNPWATTQTDSDPRYPPDDPLDFANYAAATAQHFGSKVTDYEVWNEPNAGSRFYKPNPAGDPAGYAHIVEDAADAIKQVDPSLRVALAGLVYREYAIVGSISALDFLTAMFDEIPDLGAHVDAFGVHAYPNYPPIDAPESTKNGEVPMVDMIQGTRDFADAHGAADAAMWVTEFGWPTLGIDAPTQRDYMARGFLLAASQKVPFTCWYTLFDLPSGTITEKYFGIMSPYDATQDPPATPKDAYPALVFLDATLGDFAFARDLGDATALAAAKIHLLTFADSTGAEKYLAVWSEDADHRVELPLDPSVTAVRLGPLDTQTWTPVPGVASTHRVDLDVSGTPTLVELQ